MDNTALPMMVAMFKMEHHVQIFNEEYLTFPCPHPECDWAAHLPQILVNEHTYYHVVLPPVIEHIEEDHKEIYDEMRNQALAAMGESDIRERNRGREQILVACPSVRCWWYRVCDVPRSQEEANKISYVADEHYMDHFIKG